MVRALGAATIALAAQGWAIDINFDSTGVRTGFSMHASADRFIQTEAFAKWNLFQVLDLCHAATVRLQFESSAGWLSGRGTDAVLGTFGPAMRVDRDNFPLAFLAGAAPTVVSEQVFGDKDLASSFQFTSYLGFELRPWSRLTIGYRFQHMSNAGMGGSNPGLNLNMFSLGCTF